jgi:lipoteichoic acid synthase
MKVDHREVTPFLNSLKCDTTVYYNGMMRENVTIGESSDGQFVYMSGVLPLRSFITVSKARNVTLYGLPKMLGKRSRMVIPTFTSMWNQDEMCNQYGFNQLFSSSDYADGNQKILNDEQVFQLAMQKDKDSNQPFFSVILTMSMHQPYTKQIDSTFQIKDSSISAELACYLNACHYTDRQLSKYIEHLKKTGLYEKSLIVIAADHPVHNTDFGGVCKDIPFYIVNIPQELRDRMWKSECNQIDVYTTLLDLFDVKSDWFGMGQSLLSPNYNSSVDAKKWEVSEWIIMGNYFSNQ